MPEPKIYRGPQRYHPRLQVWLPYARGNRTWIKDVCGAGTRPEWDANDKVWLVARPHFLKLVDACAERFGSVRVVEDYSTQSLCTESCSGANPETVDTCECVCGGDQHGSAKGRGVRGDWILVQEELLVKHDYKQRTWRKLG